jgi:long-chain acyl-CoA synthetase
MNLAKLLDETAAKHSDRKAIHFEDPMVGVRELTYGELSVASSRCAGGLRALGVKPGDRVAIHMPNLPQFVIAIWGILKAGGVPSPMNPQLKKREIVHQLKDSNAKIIIGLLHLIAEVDEAVKEMPNVKVITVGGESPHMRFSQLLEAEPHFVEREDSDIALQPYTSGTTGHPKGVLLSHGNLISNIKNVQKIIPLSPEDDRVLIPIPMFHITGMTVMMLVPLTSGSTIHPMLRWDAELCFELIQKHKITNFLSVPTIYIDMLNNPKIDEYDLSSLELCGSGGARMPVPIMEAYEQKFGICIHEGYGLTETSPVTHTNMAAPERLVGSIGHPIAETECKIVDEEGKELGIGEVGELLIRGPQVMQGYHNNPEATAAAIEPDGFFHTGDTAEIDKNGYFFIVDRVKDMINVGGLNVYPKEIEHVLYEHKVVAECAVVGVPDERKGETVKAFIVLKADVEPTEALAEEIKTYCLNALAAYKHPRYVEFIPQLPKTGSGKIQKYILRDRG